MRLPVSLLTCLRSLTGLPRFHVLSGPEPLSGVQPELSRALPWAILSPITIVGAMVVGPEFGPLAGIAVGLRLRRMDAVRRGIIALVAGFAGAIAATAAVAVFGGLPVPRTARTWPLPWMAGIG